MTRFRTFVGGWSEMVSNGKGPFPRMIHGTCQREQAPGGSPVPLSPPRADTMPSAGLPWASAARQNCLSVSTNSPCQWQCFLDSFLERAGRVGRTWDTASEGRLSTPWTLGGRIGSRKKCRPTFGARLAQAIAQSQLRQHDCRLSACQIGQNGDAATRPNPLYTPTPWTSLQSEMFTSVAIYQQPWALVESSNTFCPCCKSARPPLACCPKPRVKISKTRLQTRLMSRRTTAWYFNLVSSKLKECNLCVRKWRRSWSCTEINSSRQGFQKYFGSHLNANCVNKPWTQAVPWVLCGLTTKTALEVLVSHHSPMLSLLRMGSLTRIRTIYFW